VLEIVLISPSGLRLVVRLRLAHAAEVAGGDLEVGGSFDRLLTSEEAAAFSGAPSPGSGPAAS
jgi:hypothetical protein